MPLAPPLSTTDLKLALFRREVLEVYAEANGVDLTPEPVCSVCGGAPAEEPAECDHPRCPSFVGADEPVEVDHDV